MTPRAPPPKAPAAGGEICSLGRRDDDDDDEKKRRSSLGARMMGMVGLGKKSSSQPNPEGETPLQTGPHPFRPLQTRSDCSKPVQTNPHPFRPVHTRSDWSTRSDQSKPVQTGPRVHTGPPVQTRTNKTRCMWFKPVGLERNRTPV